MTITSEPGHLLVRATGQSSPLYILDGANAAGFDGPTRNTALDDPELALSARLVQELAEWSRVWAAQGTASPKELRARQKRGLELARSVAVHLGSLWVVRYWDEGHSTTKFVCWQCPRLHWSAYAHTSPPVPLCLTVEGEYGWLPLRAEGVEDFAPDDPAFGLDLSDELVADLYQWSDDIDANMELYLQERDEDSDSARRGELEQRGERLTERLAYELGPEKTATYRGLA
ncbi:hypothetical protein AB0M94_00575 [Streptomyces xanthochromogenes]|uniref:hypothetical protein n=1 Tax=Streptomyces xanthochromogenes TaxID=67384 RepID=UPI003414C3BE